jgi:hypothetical protein
MAPGRSGRANLIRRGHGEANVTICGTASAPEFVRTALLPVESTVVVDEGATA